jgi:preprotein translocase subunit SecD
MSPTATASHCRLQGPVNTTVLDQAMNSAKDVIDRRINALGTLEPTIIRQGADRIVVQVPGLQDPQALKELIGKTAKLEFKLVDDGADPDANREGQGARWQPDFALSR